MPPRAFHITGSVGGREGSISARHFEAAEGGAARWLVLAHGAGAGQDSPFMVTFARALAARGVQVVTFDFPYMHARRRVPDTNATLESCWRAVAAAVREMAGSSVMCIGGKSMGGRIASQVAAGAAGERVDADGLVFLGYPLHPPGRTDRPRVGHWPDVQLPALFVQGTRDAFGTVEEVRANLSRFAGSARLLPIEGGDHSFKVPARAGRTQDELFSSIQDAVAAWIAAIRRS